MWLDERSHIYRLCTQRVIELRNPQMHQLYILERQTRTVQGLDQEYLSPRPFDIAHALAPQVSQALHPCAGVLNQPVLGHLPGEGGNDGQVHPCCTRLDGWRVAYISNIQGSGTDRLKDGGPTREIGQIQLETNLFALATGIQQMPNEFTLIGHYQFGFGVHCRMCSAHTHGGRPRQKSSTRLQEFALVHSIFPTFFQWVRCYEVPLDFGTTDCSCANNQLIRARCLCGTSYAKHQSQQALGVDKEQSKTPLCTVHSCV